MKLLLAEDDALLADALTVQLQHAGFEVEHAPSGPVAEYLLLKQRFDSVILDLGLPLVDGLTVLKQARADGLRVPVLVLTALDGLEDRVAGLNAGADDYLTKPFDFPELEARLRALLRRAPLTGQATAALAADDPLQFDREARRIVVNGEAQDLSPRESLLLELLLSRRNQVVNKEQIAHAWGADRSESGAAASTEVYIHRLRRKLEASGLVIRTVRGLGYLLETQGR